MIDQDTTPNQALRYDEGKQDMRNVHPAVLGRAITQTVEFDARFLIANLTYWFFNRTRITEGAMPTIILIAGPALAYGAIKYDQLNYAKGMPYSAVFNSGMRHALAVASGEAYDPESGLRHISHIAANALFAVTYEVLGFDNGPFDDRPAKEKRNV